MDPLIKSVRISGIVEETPDARTFVLEPLGGWKPVYEPGQYLTLVFPTGFGEKRRSYSIPSAPVLSEPLAITVKRMVNGEFSRKLVNNARVNDILLTSGINGLFTLPAAIENTGQFFFLAAGSGITPCFSLIKTLLYTTEKKIVLIYSSRSPEDAIFYRELTSLQERFASRLVIRFLFSNSNDIMNKRLSSWLFNRLLAEHLSVPPGNALFYLCGPFAYMQAITITLLINGVPQENIKTENFDTTPRTSRPVPPDVNPHKVHIDLYGRHYELMVQYPNTVTEAAKQAGIQLPYSCEAGRCASCIATCTRGSMWMAYNQVLTDKEITEGRVLTCQAYPVGGDAEIVF